MIKSGDIMLTFGTMDPKELSVLAEAVALALADDRSAEDINVLGNFIVAVGGLLLTIAAQMQTVQSVKDKQKQISDLNSQIKQLEKELKSI